MSKKCCVPGCQATGQTMHRFPNPKTKMNLFNYWLQVLCIDELNSLEPIRVYTNKRICFAHFKPSCKSPGNPKLHRYSVPTIGVSVIQEVDIREFVKGAVPSIFNHDEIANSKVSAKPVELNENDLETKSDKIVNEPEVPSAPILFVSSSADYEEKEEVVTSSNKQLDANCEVSKKETVQNAHCTGQCKAKADERERKLNLAMNEISELHKQVNILQNQNSRLDRRVKSMKTLLRHFKKSHAT